MLTTVGVIAGLIVVGAAPPGQPLDIAAIQQAIEAAGASWEAGPNWTTELTPAERQKLLGWDYASEPEPVYVPPTAVPQTQPASSTHGRCAWPMNRHEPTSPRSRASPVATL